MITYFLIGFLWLTVALMSCQIIWLNQFAKATIENLHTLNQLVLKQTGEPTNGKD